MHLLKVLAITAGIVQLSVFLTTIYLHRTITHGALRLHPVIANLMHLQLALFTGIQPRQWAAVHRKHHHFSDQHGDPHSPKLLGMWTVLFGNYFYYRSEARNPAVVMKYTPDYTIDLIDRIPLIRFGVLGSLGIFALLFGWTWGLTAWIFHMAAYVLLNSSINSLGHVVGYRNFENGATNSRLLAILTAGEGLHNNHHAFPFSPRFAKRPGEFDPSWPVVKLLIACGLAAPSREAVETA